MSTWTGVSHARMTRSMQALSGGAHKVLAALRRRIPDGTRRKASQAEIAAWAKVSEGTVSAAMKELTGRYLARHYLGRGRGRGYEIEMLPPPEQQLKLPFDAPPKGSESDPSHRSLTDGVPMPDHPRKEGSDSDPSLFLDHVHEQQQQTATSPQPEADRPGPADQLAPATIAALRAAGAHPKLILRVAAVNPACTPADVAAALSAAERKPGVHTPPGLALECLAQRQPVVVPRERPDPPPARASAPPPAAPPRLAAPAPPPPDLDDDNPLALARRLLPADSPVPDQIYVAQRLLSGDSPEAALAALAADLERRGLIFQRPAARASPPPGARVIPRYGHVGD